MMNGANARAPNLSCRSCHTHPSILPAARQHAFLLDTLHPVQADYDDYNFEEDAYDYVGYDNEEEPEYDYDAVSDLVVIPFPRRSEIQDQ